MASPNDFAMGDDDTQHHEPFSVEENIQQLNAIDRAMVELMQYTATALNALTTPASLLESTGASADAPRPSVSPEAQKDAFRSATDTFLGTLHTIDVRMKRQILALEEAGIVNLSNGQRQDPSGTTKASLRPNGLGFVGNFDVGWLNSRGTRNERDMELELWEKAKGFLGKELENCHQ